MSLTTKDISKRSIDNGGNSNRSSTTNLRMIAKCYIQFYVYCTLSYYRIHKSNPLHFRRSVVDIVYCIPFLILCDCIAIYLCVVFVGELTVFFTRVGEGKGVMVCVCLNLKFVYMYMYKGVFKGGGEFRGFNLPPP